MLKSIFVLFFFFISFISSNSQNLPKPTKVQYKWHEQERIMFIHFAPTTWTEKEQDDHSVPLEHINPKDLNTDQWCEAALAWGAKQIIFVAKHSGGFCWWQTETTNYGIRNTPYKNGDGDIFKELAESCKKFGLNLGVYIYPGDRTWGAMIGSGGKTLDPSKQGEYNEVFRTQLTEVLAKYGEMTEVWFDGSCVIDISDIIEKYAQNAVVFQGPHATIRWPGTESGKLFYPAWNTIKSEDLKTGISTQYHGDPGGDVWAPLEADTPLYDHYWFWSPQKAEKRKSVSLLMDIYYQSVGYGGVLLLNATPDTSGLIPEADIQRYREFGAEIDRRFSNPLASTQQKQGKKVMLEFENPAIVNHAILMEDYQEGERIREYRIEGLSGGKWVELAKGLSVGRKKIDYFQDIELESMRLIIDQSVAKPLIRSFSAYYVSKFTSPEKKSLGVWAKPEAVAFWDQPDPTSQEITMKINLSDKINVPGQYILTVIPEIEQQVEIRNTAIFYQGQKAMNEFISINGNRIRINQTAQITDKSDLAVELTLHLKKPCKGKINFSPEMIH